MEENQELNIQETQTKIPVKKKKKRKTGLIFFLVILILAAAGGTACYLWERQKPVSATEKYLDSIRKMNFEVMESMLQSSDLSALDNADIRDAAYTDFFKSINEKMSYKIRKNSFDIQNGTAQVTARIRYVDGSDIYKETVSEFLRQVVSEMFSGKTLTEEEARQKLAALLSEKAASLEDKFSETDIVYPLIKINGQWKIVALDDETVKLMSANFKSVEDEIMQSLSASDADSLSGVMASQAPSASEEDTIDMTTEKFSIRYTRHSIEKDFAGNPCLLVYYDYTNNGTTASSAMVDITLHAYQNGTALNAAIPETNDDSIDQYLSEIQPGQTINICQAFSITDMSDVTLQATEAFSFGNGQTTSQILKLQ